MNLIVEESFLFNDIFSVLIVSSTILVVSIIHVVNTLAVSIIHVVITIVLFGICSIVTVLHRQCF